MATIAAIGDLHLDKLKNLFPQNHLQLQLNELDKAVHYNMKQGVSDIILLGDVADTPRLSYEAQVAFINWLCKWDNRASIHVILGNHDVHQTGVHSLQLFQAMQENKLFKTIRFYDKPTVVDIDDLRVNFQPYPHCDDVRGALNIGHFEVSGSIRDNGHIIKKAHNVNKDAAWVLGHLHTMHSVNNCHYSGTLYQLNFGESLPKGFLSVRAKSSGKSVKYKIEQVHTKPAFELRNLVVECKADLRKIEDNQNIKYKLFANSNFTLPYDVLAKHANVVKLEGFSTQEELDAVIADSFIDIGYQTLELPSVTEGLKQYLKGKGVERAKIKRALAIVNELRGNTSITGN